MTRPSWRPGRPRYQPSPTKLLGVTPRSQATHAQAAAGDCVELEAGPPRAAANLIEDLGESRDLDRIPSQPQRPSSPGLRSRLTASHGSKVQLDDIHIVQDPRLCGTPDARHWTGQGQGRGHDGDHVAARTALDDAAKEGTQVGASRPSRPRVLPRPLAGQTYQHLEADRAKIFPTAQLRTSRAPAPCRQIAGGGEWRRSDTPRRFKLTHSLHHASWFEQGACG